MSTRFWTLASLALAAGTTAACTHVDASEPVAPRPVRVQAAAAAATPTGTRYSATIEPLQQLMLAFKASGYVDRVSSRTGADGRVRAAQAGDRVTRGAVLAQVRTAEYREKVAQGRARLAESNAALVKARLDLGRATTLFAKTSLTRPELDAAQAAFDGAEARVAAARAEVELAETALRDCALVAPASGVLLDRRVEVGSLVSTGSAGFTLADVSAVKARFGVPDAMVGAVALGARLAVTAEGLAGRTFDGRVTALAPAADAQSRVFDVEVTIANADGALRPGMIGTVTFGAPAAGAAPPLTVPMGAVVKPQTGGRYAVVVVEERGGESIARLRHVELGGVVGNGVAIATGLVAGDRVVVTGATLLADGDPVRVMP